MNDEQENKPKPTLEEWKLGGWLSAALDCKTSCAEFKRDINSWMNCFNWGETAEDDSKLLGKKERNEMYARFQEIKGCQDSMEEHNVKFYDDILMNTAPLLWTWGDLRRTRALSIKINGNTN